MGMCHTLDNEPNIRVETRRESFILGCRSGFDNHLILNSSSVEMSYELLARLLVSMEHTPSLARDMWPEINRQMDVIRAEYRLSAESRTQRQIIAVSGDLQVPMPPGSDPDSFASALLRDQTRTPHGSLRLYLISEEEREQLGDDWPVSQQNTATTYCRSGWQIWRLPGAEFRLTGNEFGVYQTTAPTEIV